MIAETTGKLIAEIDGKLCEEFEKKVYGNGQTKKFILEKLVRQYLLEDEGNPKGFPKRSHPVVTRRRSQ